MGYKHITAVFILCSFSASLWAGMTPNAPVKDFRFPRFDEANGYTQWVLQGEKGIYDSEEQIRVDEMALRVYSGDERMVRELTLDSPQATLRLKENRAFSEESIEIAGANFTITGSGWEWVGETKEIVVEADTVVEFSQAIEGGLSKVGPSGKVKRTVIKSDRLVLQTTEEEYRFEFSGSVRAISGEMDLRSKLLIALVDMPEGAGATPAPDPGKLDSVRQVVAMGSVRILEAGRTVRAGKAQFLPREGQMTLTESPEIEVAGAYLSGSVVRSESGKLVVEGSSSEGRAQMILTETGGLGLQGMSALGEETIVLADEITMQQIQSENRFLFEKHVEVMSGAVQLKASRMRIEAEAAGKGSAGGSEAAEKGDLQVGLVRRLIAEGGVRIEQEGQVATGEQVVFYPSEGRSELTGQPQVTNGEAIVSGHKMELRPNLAIVTSDGTGRVKVELPVMPDLGYQATVPAAPSGEEDAAAVEGVEAEVTVVQSQKLRMSDEPERTLFRFTDSVEISGTNLDATCERLDVIAAEKPVAATQETGAHRLEVQRIEAHGSVVIRQAGRTGSSRRAFIMPQKGEMVLEEDAVVVDERGQVSGHRMTFLQGQRRAIVEGGGPGQERARITLPAMPGGEND